MWVSEELDDEVYFEGRYIRAIIFFKYDTDFGFNESEYICDWDVQKVLIEDKVFKFDDLDEDTKGSVNAAIRFWAEDWEPCRWSFDYE
jgi:hypothetical protein